MSNYYDLYSPSSMDLCKTKLLFPKHRWGRIIPVNGLSLSMMHRPTRHALANDNYIDIDMVNASQNIINELMKQNNINVRFIDNYCKNREIYLKNIQDNYECNRDKAKQLIISLSFGGGYDKWIKDNNHKKKLQDLIDLETDYQMVMEHIWKINNTIIDDVLKENPTKYQKYKTEKSILKAKKRTCLSLFYQTIERHIQEGMTLFLVQEKKFILEDIIPCQDGFMILKKNYYDGIIKDIEEQQLNKWGFVIPMKTKPFDEAIKIPPIEIKILSINEKFVADEIKKMYGDKILYTNKTFYVFYNNKWNEGEEALKIINKIISEDIVEYLINFFKSVCVSDTEINGCIFSLEILTRTKSAHLHSIREHLIAITKMPYERFNNKPYLLGFKNGVLDLKMMCEKDEDGNFIYNYDECFRDYEYNDFITINTNYDFTPFDENDEENKLIIEEIVEFFESVMPNKEHLLLLLQELASCLDGLLYQRFIMFNGSGGNGKGAIFELMNLLLGDYFKKANNEILKGFSKLNQASEDMMDLMNKRMIVFEEIGDKVDNDLMKRVTGGGQITGRRLYKGNESFTLSATIFASFNGKMKLKYKPDGNSELRRLIDMFFTRNFTDRKEKIGKIEIKDNIEILWCQSNPKYTTTEWGLKIRNGLLNMLLNIYRTYCDGNNGIVFTIPDDVQRRIEDFVDAQNIFNTIFDDYYEKVDDQKQFIKLCDIWDNIQFNSDYKNLPFKEKRKYNRKYFDEWIGQKLCVSANKDKCKIIRGYKNKTDDIEDIDEKTDTEIL